MANYDMFLQIAIYGNEVWKGNYTESEVRENARDYYEDYLQIVEISIDLYKKGIDIVSVSIDEARMVYIDWLGRRI